MDTLSLTKEARIYNGEKTISLTNGAGKTGQTLGKEWNQLLYLWWIHFDIWQKKYNIVKFKNKKNLRKIKKKE